MLLCEYVCVHMCMCLHMCHTTRISVCVPTPREVISVCVPTPRVVVEISHQLSPQLYCSHTQLLARVEGHKGEGRVLWESEGAQTSVRTTRQEHSLSSTKAVPQYIAVQARINENVSSC